jgi:hypothetical protein
MTVPLCQRRQWFGEPTALLLYVVRSLLRIHAMLFSGVSI